MTTLRESLSHWQDIEDAEYALGYCLGLFGPNDDPNKNLKHVFWCVNSVGDCLADILQKFVGVGILLYRDEIYPQFCWNPEFKGTWE